MNTALSLTLTATLLLACGGKTAVGEGMPSPSAELHIADVEGYVGALSGDGRAVVVNQPTQSANHRGFVWFVDSTALETVPLSESDGSWFTSTTDDGSVVFGYYLESDFDAEVWEAIQWTKAGGLESVEGLRAILAASGDGRALLGRTRDFGALKIGNDVVRVPTVGQSSSPVALSHDGSTVAGQTYLVSGPSTREGVFVWRPGEEAHVIETPTDYAQAACLNGDGSLVFGFSYYEDAPPEAQFRAFRWSERSGYEELGDFGPTAASGDGSVVVGTRYLESRSWGVIWDRERGARDLNDELDARGVDRQEVSISGASAVSEDGRSVAGTASWGAEDHPFHVHLP